MTTMIVSVDGPGFIEVFCWETSPGYAFTC